MPRSRPPTPLKQTTVRYPPDLHRMIAAEAEGEGVSVAQFVREAALGRAIYLRTKRGEMDATVKEVERVLREMRDTGTTTAPDTGPGA